MGVGSYGDDGSTDDGTGPKTTYFQFQNPNHPGSKEHDNPEQAQMHFKAARFIQNRLGPNRHNLVGDFLVAVYQYEENGDEEALQEVIDRITS